MKPLFRFFGTALLLCVFSVSALARPKSGKSSSTPPVVPTEKQLEQFSRALKEPNPASAYAKLSAFAEQKSTGILGMRAALALGYYDYTKGNYAQAQKWFSRAQSDPLLRDYSLYWSAQTRLALKNNEEALAQLQQLRKDFPASIMTEQALQSLGATALALDQPAVAVAALDAYPLTGDRPALLFLRAHAREAAGQPVQAAVDYEHVYLRFATSEEGKEAAQKLDSLRSSLGSQISPIPLDQQVTHAVALFVAKDWMGARKEYAQLLPQLSGPDRERAALRVLECGVSLGAGPSQLAALEVTDPDVDAERFYSLAQWYRSQKQAAPLSAAIESAVMRAPSSSWAEAALFVGGNYYWSQMDRDTAAGYYKRLAENFPKSLDATAAQWRIAWVAVLKRQPEAAELLTQHLQRYPGSPFTADALYWLGRLSEESGNQDLARSYYGKLLDRYQQNYFEALASARLRTMGSGPAADLDLLATIPPVPAAKPLGDVIPPAAAERQARADALRSVAFDSSAQLELRQAYVETGEPRLLLEAAQAAIGAQHFGAAIMMVRQIFPQIESRPFDSVPPEVWQIAYPLPFADSIRRWSSHAGIDSMLAAGLIRQESAFEPEAHSVANALGLMQILPKTALGLAKQSNVKYSRARLTEPDYNVRLGTAYLAGLEKNFGSVEPVLAAYNAGEDRVMSWTAGQSYREPAEFVDSIPFTETRDYVEIVTRNAEIYRKLYGATNEPSQFATRNGSR